MSGVQLSMYFLIQNQSGDDDCCSSAHVDMDNSKIIDNTAGGSQLPSVNVLCHQHHPSYKKKSEVIENRRKAAIART